MKSLLTLSVSVLVLALPAIASADYQCTYSCGSKPHQEQKTGFGRTQQEATRAAQAQNCTQYVGGRPQFFLGCVELDNGRNDRDYNPDYDRDYNPDYNRDWRGGGRGGHGGGGHWGPREEWKCTYTCGSKPHQEPKVGFGRTQREAAYNAQNTNCLQYVGGRPQFFRGCERTR